MKKILIFIAVLLLSVGLTYSQRFTNLNYNISVPFAESADFIENISFRGGSFNYTVMLTDGFGLGLHGSLQTFYEEVENGEINFDNGVITGQRYNYLNTVPLMLAGRFVSDTEESVIFYGGLGLGTIWAEHRSEIGLYTFNESDWHLAVSPETGLIIPFNENLGINLGLRYQYGFETDDLPADTYLSIAIGLVFINDGGY